MQRPPDNKFRGHWSPQVSNPTPYVSFVPVAPSKPNGAQTGQPSKEPSSSSFLTAPQQPTDGGFHHQQQAPSLPSSGGCHHQDQVWNGVFDPSAFIPTPQFDPSTIRACGGWSPAHWPSFPPPPNNSSTWNWPTSHSTVFPDVSFHQQQQQQQWVPPPQQPPSQVSAQRIPDLRFFQNLKEDVTNRTQRNYYFIVDRSGTMNLESRWEQARRAVAHLAPSAIAASPDGCGISLLFFSDRVNSRHGIRDVSQVMHMFDSHEPSGSTDLTRALREASEHFFMNPRRATFLVITDGIPDDRDSVKLEIAGISQRLGCDEQLSISFIQVGDDKGAERYLEELDDKLTVQPWNAKFDIVDKMTSKQLLQSNMTFEEFIRLSIDD